MKKHSYFVLLLAGALLMLCAADVCGQYRRSGHRSSFRAPGLRMGLNPCVQEGVSFGIDAIYYCGDADKYKGPPLISGFDKDALSALFHVAYHQPLSNHFALRYTVSAGWVNGNNGAKEKNKIRQFRSILVQPAIGFECYPDYVAGFMIYAGIALPTGLLAKYEYAYETNPRIAFAPAAQLGLGYTWTVSSDWAVTFNVMGTYALIEINGNNHIGLDGIGRGSSYATGQSTSKIAKFYENDGYFSIGIYLTHHTY